jgi:hypothetical protein
VHRFCFLQGLQVLPAEPPDGGAEVLLPRPCPHSKATIMGHFLAFLRAFVAEGLAKSFGADFQESRAVQYCITVPAGMPRAAQQIVVECAARRLAPAAACLAACLRGWP